jgi:hypothetical protein
MSSSNRKPYLTATSLTQDLLDACADNLSCQIEMIADIQTPTGLIRASDRNKYVGGIYYEALLQFPQINRTVGEWISNEVEFSTIELELSNADGRFNNFLPEGANYQSWIGNTVEIKIGLAEVASSYKTIFYGVVTDVGGFKRSIKSITIIARDTWDKLNVMFPKFAFNLVDYPYLDPSDAGTLLPFILGDWYTDLSQTAVVTSTIVNANDDDVIYNETTNPLPIALVCVISFNNMDVFTTDDVYLVRNDLFYKIHPSDVLISSNKTGFVVAQRTGNTMLIEKAGEPAVMYTYSESDKFVVRCKENTTNIILQCKKILETYAGVTSGDYDATSWGYFETKLAAIKSRVWIQEPESAINYVLSLLEQVQLEAFIDSNRKLKLTALHFDEFDATPDFTIFNWDLEKDTFTIQLDEQNNFNRLRGFYNQEPLLNENAFSTAYYRNNAAITQASKEITKQIAFPNLYDATQVEAQVTNILKLASAYCEFITCSVTWRFLLQELNNMVKINVTIGSTVFTNTPALIRSIAYNPQGVKLDIKLWSFQMLPFGSYNPSFSGICGGQNATITKE